MLIARLLVLGFFTVLFLQSGFDKVTDRKGNLDWLTGHFANSPLAKLVPFMLTFITMVELAAGVLCGGGAAMLLVTKEAAIGTVGLGVSGLALLMLFFGQRMAKDYPGAATLATYFGVMLIGLIIMG